MAHIHSLNMRKHRARRQQQSMCVPVSLARKEPICYQFSARPIDRGLEEKIEEKKNPLG